MNRARWCFAVLWLLAAVAGASAAAEKGSGLDNPFFAYSVKASDNDLAKLGYAPIHNVYTGIHLDKSPLYAPDLKEQIQKLRGTNTIFWLTLHGKKTDRSDAQFVEIIRELAAVADGVGIRVALYPHYGFYLATARDGLRLVKQVDRKNVGLTLNLCHELMAGNGRELFKILDETAPHLFVVTINGADLKEKDQRMGWDRLIQPLGQGNFDTFAFLQKVRAVGFRGPIGLQCYGLKADPLVHLKQSITTWNTYRAKMAAP